jgi:hypothetical protein
MRAGTGHRSMDDLYETDILRWSEQQSDLLRRHLRGERVNELIDWENVAEEIESVGREQLHAVESLLVQALVHMLKAHAWPQSRDAAGWRAEAARFRGDARRRYVRSMRQRLDVDALYRDALRALPETMDNQPPGPVPDACPVTLDELLAAAG